MRTGKRILAAVCAALLTLGMIVTVSLITARAEESVVEIRNEYSVVIASMTEADYEALSQVVYWESARCCCPHEVNVAVVETVMNRMLTGGTFRNESVYTVCHQKGAFVCKPIPKKASRELIDDAISQVVLVGRQVLPGTDYCYFATKKQSLGRDHLWIGDLKANGKPRKGKGMYFCREK